jgi:hypothetical protein
MPPTAVHDVADVQEIPLKPPIPMAGFGAPVTVHFVPFQVSTSGPDPLVYSKLPAAMHDVAEVHETPPMSRNWLRPVGPAKVVAAHFVPFHHHARVEAKSAQVTMQALAVAQDTLMCSGKPTLTFGLFLVHVLPFQVSTRARQPPLPAGA